MAASLALAALALRVGLSMRRARRGRGPRGRGMCAAHLRIAKPAVALLMLGMLGGPASAIWVRGWGAFESFHGAIGLLAATLFGAAALLGHRLEVGAGRPRDAHALLGMLAMLAAAVAAVAGFILLP